VGDSLPRDPGMLGEQILINDDLYTLIVLMRNRDVERAYVRSAFRVCLFSLDFVQKSVVFLNNGALKSALAPAQGITVIPTYCEREMLISVLFDEFNHILDGHRNLLTDVDATGAIASSPSLRI
jgi:hypothetical protein